MTRALVVAFLVSVQAMAAPCVPDSPCPIVAWDALDHATEDFIGYRLFWKYPEEPETAWTAYKDLLCTQDFTPDETDPPDAIIKSCQGEVDFIGVPPHRWHGSEAEEVQICVKAFDAANRESVNCSNVLTICMPVICRPGGGMVCD